jgi:ribosomal protein L3 glutamine methyltransferase
VPRSFIGELIHGDVFTGDGGLIAAPDKVARVLDLCTGSGCLAVLAAHAFPAAMIDAVDLSADALDVARRNVSEAGLDDRIALFEGDLFAPLAGRRYDLIITNPPYVGAQAMDALPPEFRHEPAMALASGADGFDIVRRILADAPAHLHPGGGLVCEIGEDRDLLEADYPHLPFLWLDTEASAGEVFWLPAAAFRVSARRGASAEKPRRRTRAGSADAASGARSAKRRPPRR